VLRASWNETPDRTTIDGCHDGYKDDYAPLLHRRVITALHEPRLWLILDRLSGPPGHIARSFIHLHPDHPQLAFTPLGPVTVSETNGWYSEQFGVKQPNRVITLTAATPAWFGYVIAAGETAPRATMTEKDDGVVIEIATADWQGEVEIRPEVPFDS
jgi:hypothetical protein